jgi:hypothetical protein
MNGGASEFRVRRRKSATFLPACLFVCGFRHVDKFSGNFEESSLIII